MGAKASTEKHPNDGENEKFKFGSCSMQGWRQTNEDAMISQLDIGDGNSVFAVFDGHGGEHVALFCKKHFVQLLKKKKTYKAKNYEKALEETFLQIDRMLLQKTGQESLKEIVVELQKNKDRKVSKKLLFLEDNRLNGLPFYVGCTACVVFVTKDHIYCANSGDSRSCLAKKLEDKKVNIIEMSQDHKPANEAEKERIQAAGGFVFLNRINGQIAISRALGDWEFKVQKGKKIDFSIEEVRKMQVCPIPDIKKIPLQNDYDFMIIACDGIWDVYKNEEAVELAFMTREAIKNKKVTKKIKAQYPDGVIPLQISKIIEKIMSKGMAETSLGLSKPRGLGTDNMSCIIVEFKPGFADGATPDPEEDQALDSEGSTQKKEFLSMIDVGKAAAGTTGVVNATGEQFTEDQLNEMPNIPDKDEEEEINKNDDSDIRESIKQFFDCEEDMKQREPEFTGNFAEEGEEEEEQPKDQQQADQLEERIRQKSIQKEADEAAQQDVKIEEEKS